MWRDGCAPEKHVHFADLGIFLTIWVTKQLGIQICQYFATNHDQERDYNFLEEFRSLISCFSSVKALERRVLVEIYHIWRMVLVKKLLAKLMNKWERQRSNGREHSRVVFVSFPDLRSTYSHGHFSSRVKFLHNRKVVGLKKTFIQSEIWRDQV